MKKEFFKEIITSIILILILIFFWNPFYLWMPDAMMYTLASVLLIITALYAGLIVREKYSDEREEELRSKAGRVGYVTGILVLAFGIVYQSVMMNKPDLFLVLALAVMIISKLFFFIKKL